MKRYIVTVTALESNLQRHKVEVAAETENIEHLNCLAAAVVKRHYFVPTDDVVF